MLGGLGGVLAEQLAQAGDDLVHRAALSARDQHPRVERLKQLLLQHGLLQRLARGNGIGAAPGSLFQLPAGHDLGGGAQRVLGGHTAGKVQIQHPDIPRQRLLADDAAQRGDLLRRGLQLNAAPGRAGLQQRDRQHRRDDRRDGQRRAAHDIAHLQITEARRRGAARHGGVDAAEHRQHLHEQHGQDHGHQAEQYRRVGHGAAQLLVEPGPVRVVARKAPEHLLGAARQLARGQHPAGITGEIPGSRAGVGQRAAVCGQVVVHGLGGVVELTLDAGVAQEGCALLGADARGEQHGHIFTKCAHGHALQFLCHDSLLNMYSGLCSLCRRR